MHTAQSLSTPTLHLDPREFRPDEGWVEGVFYHPLFPNGCWFLALVYNEPSKFGYRNGRVSKLDIMPVPTRKFGVSYDDQLFYSNDRKGHGHSNAKGCPQKLVRALVKELEALPKLYTANA